MNSFDMTVHQNEFLPEGSTDVHAVITLSGDGGSGVVGETELRRPVPPVAGRAVVVMGDCSGSMTEPIDPSDKRSVPKINAARRALATAVSQIDDGTLFAVIAGNAAATMVYPVRGGLAAASDETRAEAINNISRLHAQGGTAISSWLDLARSLFEAVPDAVRLGILVTDGRDESEPREVLDRMLERCQGVFQCDCRGVGVNWSVAELRDIASALMGEVDMIRSAEQMESDFKSLIAGAMAKTSADVSLRVWTPKSAEIVFLKQVSPTLEEIGQRALEVSDQIRDFPTGAWGAEERDFHVCIRVRPGDIGDEMLAARVSLMVGGETRSQALVRAVWTDDVGLSARVVSEVAHYTGQAELAVAIQGGLEARASGDEHTATIKLGEAVRLATEAGNTGTIRLLEKVVEVEDAVTGTVRLKRSVDRGDEMELDTRSTKTVRVRRNP